MMALFIWAPPQITRFNVWKHFSRSCSSFLKFFLMPKASRNLRIFSSFRRPFAFPDSSAAAHILLWMVSSISGTVNSVSALDSCRSRITVFRLPLINTWAPDSIIPITAQVQP